MPQAPETRSLRDKVTSWSKDYLLKPRSLVALGAAGLTALTLAGCGGSGEAVASASPNTTVLTNSEVFQKLSLTDQNEVKKDMKLNFTQFESLAPPVRAEDALVLMDANKGNYLNKIANVGVPGVPGQVFGHFLNSANNTYENLGEVLYENAIHTNPSNFTKANFISPYIEKQDSNAIAEDIASTGDPIQLQIAEDIVGGMTYPTGSAAEAANTGLADEISSLKQISENKTSQGPTHDVPIASVDNHSLANLPTSLAETFFDYNSQTKQYSPGVDNKQRTSATYDATPVDLTDGTVVTAWSQDTSTTGAVPVGMRPNDP